MCEQLLLRQFLRPSLSNQGTITFDGAHGEPHFRPIPKPDGCHSSGFLRLCPTNSQVIRCAVLGLLRSFSASLRSRISASLCSIERMVRRRRLIPIETPIRIRREDRDLFGKTESRLNYDSSSADCRYMFRSAGSHRPTALSLAHQRLRLEPIDVAADFLFSAGSSAARKQP